MGSMPTIRELRLHYGVKDGQEPENKRELILAIRRLQLQKKFGDDIPWADSIAASIYSPMLCQPWSALSTKSRDRVTRPGSGYIQQEKLHGLRALCVFNPANARPLRFFSRVSDDLTLLPLEFPVEVKPSVHTVDWRVKRMVLDGMLILTDPNAKSVIFEKHGLQLVGDTAPRFLWELLAAPGVQQWGMIRFVVFDILHYNKTDSRGMSWITRDTVASSAARQLAPLYSAPTITHLPHVSASDYTFTERGSRGVVYKKTDSEYMSSESRSLRWVKRSFTSGVSEQLSVPDTPPQP